MFSVTFDIFVFLSRRLSPQREQILFPNLKARANVAINQMKLFLWTLESRKLSKGGSCIIASVAFRLSLCQMIQAARSPTSWLRIHPWSHRIKKKEGNCHQLNLQWPTVEQFQLRHDIIRTLLLTQLRLQSAKCVSFYDDGVVVVIKKQLSAPTLNRENKFLPFRIVERLVECLEKAKKREELESSEHTKNIPRSFCCLLRNLLSNISQFESRNKRPNDIIMS